MDKNQNNKIQSAVLAQDIANATDNAKYDAEVKNILANKEILARILKHTVPEFKECSIEDIRDNYIEGIPLVGEIPVHPGSTNSKIQGINTESKIVGEGVVTFDVLFNSVNPDNRCIIKINIEANKNSYPGYPIQTRGVYYGSRVLSSEYGREFENMDYNRLVKVYSIWICSEPPEYEENSISGICFSKYDIINSIEMEKNTYDLIDVIIINLSQDCHNESEYIVGMLSTLLSDSITVEEKIDLLENKYGIPITEKDERGVTRMCNLGQAIWDKGVKAGISQGISQGRYLGIDELVRAIEFVRQGYTSISGLAEKGIPEDVAYKALELR